MESGTASPAACAPTAPFSFARWLQEAAEVYQGLMERFAPQQRTNYVALLNEWAVGFYTELDFVNEAANQQRVSQLLKDEGIDGIYVPKVYDDLCTRRVMVIRLLTIFRVSFV